MKSSKRTKLVKFQPIRKPTLKVREAWSRLATTLSAAAYSGFAIGCATEPFSMIAIAKLTVLLLIGVIMMVFSIYVLKGDEHV